MSLGKEVHTRSPTLVYLLLREQAGPVKSSRIHQNSLAAHFFSSLDLTEILTKVLEEARPETSR